MGFFVLDQRPHAHPGLSSEEDPGDVDGHLQESQGRAVLLGDLHQSVGADGRVGLHDEAFVGLQLARLQEDVVRQAHLADVMQRNRTFQHLDEVGIDLFGKGH
jgi:hypothetical protein